MHASDATSDPWKRYRSHFVVEDAPDGKLPAETMDPVAAMRIISEDLVLDGIPERNLATFVTTWMEPEAQRIIAENLHRNFIDHAEYPQTAEIEQRCIRMLADLFNAPGETTGARTQGSSEAIMLGALFRETADLAEDLVFYENYLGKTDATFTLNFSTGSAMVLAQYYNLIRLGREGYRLAIGAMESNARYLGERLQEIGPFELAGDANAEQLPLAAFRLADPDLAYDEFDIAWQVAAERGWMLPAYTMPPKADHVKMLRALVKLNLTRPLVSTLADDIAAACETLAKKGGASAAERRRVKTGVGY